MLLIHEEVLSQERMQLFGAFNSNYIQEGLIVENHL